MFSYEHIGRKLYRNLIVLPAWPTMRGMLRRAFTKSRGTSPSAEAAPPPKHPIDEKYQIDTGGHLGYEDLNSGKSADLYNAHYGASQPSLMRKAIGLVPDLADAVFIDIGCGKGRALAVASEFPFREIIGVELVPTLAEAARRNAAEISRRFPDRPPIRIVEEDASAMTLPSGRLIIYMYHPFFKKIMKKFIARIEEFVKRENKNQAFIIYYNPVYWWLFDRSRLLQRIFAEEVLFDDEEMRARTFRNDEADLIAVWQSNRQPGIVRHSGADAPIETAVPGWRVKLARSA